MRHALSIIAIAALSLLVTACSLEEPAESEVAETTSEIQTEATTFTYFTLTNPSGRSRKLDVGVYNTPSTSFNAVSVYDPNVGFMSCSEKSNPSRWLCSRDLGACSTYRNDDAVGIKVEHSNLVTPAVTYVFYGDELCTQ